MYGYHEVAILGRFANRPPTFDYNFDYTLNWATARLNSSAILARSPAL